MKFAPVAHTLSSAMSIVSVKGGQNVSVAMVCLLKIPSAAGILAFGRIGVRSGYA